VISLRQWWQGERQRKIAWESQGGGKGDRQRQRQRETERQRVRQADRDKVGQTRTPAVDSCQEFFIERPIDSSHWRRNKEASFWCHPENILTIITTLCIIDIEIRLYSTRDSLKKLLLKPCPLAVYEQRAWSMRLFDWFAFTSVCLSVCLCLCLSLSVSKIFSRHYYIERERERQTDRDIGRETEREADRQTDRKVNRYTHTKRRPWYSDNGKHAIKPTINARESSHLNARWKGTEIDRLSVYVLADPCSSKVLRDSAIRQIKIK